MSTQISTAKVKAYAAGVRHLVQQKMSRLRGAVDLRTDVSGEATFFDQIGKVTSQKKTGRHQPITFSDTPHKRRQVTPEVYDTADAIDGDDKLETIISDPAGQYAVAQARQMGRDMDDVLIVAATGTAKTGKDGGTNTSLPASQKVSHDFVDGGANSTANLTIGKLREAKEILLANEVDPEELFIAVTANQIHSLLFEAKIGNADYNEVRPLVDGVVSRFMGFNFIRTERLQTDGSGHRKCPAWAREGIALGIWHDVDTKIDERVDLRTHPEQVYTWMELGATRMEEEQVVEIACNESATLTSETA